MQYRDSSAEPQTDVATLSGLISTTEVLNTMTGRCAKVKRKPGMRIDGLVEGKPFLLKIDTCAISMFIMADLYNTIPQENIPVLERVRKNLETSDMKNI